MWESSTYALLPDNLIVNLRLTFTYTLLSLWTWPTNFHCIKQGQIESKSISSIWLFCKPNLFFRSLILRSSTLWMGYFANIYNNLTLVRTSFPTQLILCFRWESHLKCFIQITRKIHMHIQFVSRLKRLNEGKIGHL